MAKTNVLKTIGDTAAGAADIDLGAIKKAYGTKSGSDGGRTTEDIINAAKATNDYGIARAADTIEDINKTLSKERIDNSSIIARARHSVLQFPVYVSHSIQVNAAHTISKLFERVYASYVQANLAMNPIIDESEANRMMFIKKFHTNIKESADLFINPFYQPIDLTDEIMKESVFYEEQITPTMKVQFRYIPRKYAEQSLIRECERLSNEPLAGFDYLKEAKDTVDPNAASGSRRSAAAEVARRAEYKRTHDTVINHNDSNDTKVSSKPILPNSTEYNELRTTNRTLVNDAKRYSTINDDISKTKKDIADKEKQLEEAEENGDVLAKRRLPSEISDAKDNLKKLNDDKKSLDERIKKYEKSGYIIDKDGNISQITSRDSISKHTTISVGSDKRAPDVIKAPDIPVMLRDSDLKKINGMLPWMIQATFILKSNKGLDREVRYVIGVKTILHLIRPQDLAEDLQELVTGNIRTLQKVRYKSGEITFKDYMFNVKGIKASAAKSINHNKKWINTLKRLAEYEKLNGSIFKSALSDFNKGEIPVPNGTLILSQTDVTMLTNETGIDLSVIPNVKRLAKSLFLIAVAIVDNAAGTMKVLYVDESADWDIQSLASVDAELSKTDNSSLMKELNRIINR